MHFRTYVLLPKASAQTSLEARHEVAEYLDSQDFASSSRFAGRCDYFSIGGRWSGSLTLLRLARQAPDRFREFSRFWMKEARSRAQVLTRFKKSFPDFRGPIPVEREKVGYFGLKDDAQLMDRTLFLALKRGFAGDVNHTWELNEPNVISTEYWEDDEWPANAKAAEGQDWVVVVDYHG